MGALLLLLIGLPTALWVRGRLRIAEKSEAELRSAVELEIRTIADADRELFRSLQDPADRSWQQRQVDRFFSQEAVGFVPAPGFRPSQRPMEITALHYFGATARVELVRWFTPPADLSERPAGPLPFHLTWFYRQDESGQWTHVAPSDDYWGIPYSWHGTWLAIRATEVESRLIDPFADELAHLVLRACVWLECPADERYTLDFLDTLAPQADYDWWTLPAMYLVGFPDSPQARDAWRESLKLWVVEALAQARLGEEHLTQRVLYGQLLRRLQAEVRLREDSDELSTIDIDLLAQALRDREQHTLWSLWQLNVDPDDPEETRLLGAETAALLTFLEGRVGTRGLFRLLPALGEYSRMGDALDELYAVDSVGLSNDWLAFLSDLTGVWVANGAIPRVRVPFEEPYEPPPTPPPPTEPPGDQLALVCGAAIWLSNADGSGLYRLTGEGQRFDNLYWSPDGRWLVTRWAPDEAGEFGALYLLAEDGSGGRLLTRDPALQPWPLGWSPDGQEVIFYAYEIKDSGLYTTPEVRALDVGSDQMRSLPGIPSWSKDGRQMIYVPVSAQGPLGPLWLADADWGNPRPIAAQAWSWGGEPEAWSPDGNRVALTLVEEGGGSRGAASISVAVYDLATDQVGPAFTGAELKAELLRAEGALLTGEIDPERVADQTYDRIWFLGWSADGRQLLVGAEGRSDDDFGVIPMVLATVPLESFGADPSGSWGSRILALTDGRRMNAYWSPGTPDRLVLSWIPEGPMSTTTFLVDLEAGSLYSTTLSSAASWSPDGDWLALARSNEIEILDRDGNERFMVRLEDVDACQEIVWNPVADLSGLASTALKPEGARVVALRSANEE